MGGSTRGCRGAARKIEQDVGLIGSLEEPRVVVAQEQARVGHTGSGRFHFFFSAFSLGLFFGFLLDGLLGRILGRLLRRTLLLALFGVAHPVAFAVGVGEQLVDRLLTHVVGVVATRGSHQGEHRKGDDQGAGSRHVRTSRVRGIPQQPPSSAIAATTAGMALNR